MRKSLLIIGILMFSWFSTMVLLERRYSDSLKLEMQNMAPNPMATEMLNNAEPVEATVEVSPN